MFPPPAHKLDRRTGASATGEAVSHRLHVDDVDVVIPVARLGQPAQLNDGRAEARRVRYIHHWFAYQGLGT